MGIEKGRSRRFRASMCARVYIRDSLATLFAPPPASPRQVHTCAAMRVRALASDRIRIRIGSTNGRKLVTAGLSDLPAPPSANLLRLLTSTPYAHPRSLYHVALLPRPPPRLVRSSSRAVPRSLYLYLSLSLRLSQQLANLPTREPLFGNY